MAKSNSWFTGINLIVLWIAMVFLSKIIGLTTDFWWFDNLGFSQIFLITLKTKIILFVLSAVIFAGFVLFNLWISTRLGKSKISFKLKLLITGVLALFVGLSNSDAWLIVLQFFKQVSFGLQDPIFLKDVSFYIFSLPFIFLIWKFLMVCVVITFILVLLDYTQLFFVNRFTKKSLYDSKPELNPDKVSFNFSFKSMFFKLNNKILAHLAILGSFFFILLSVNHYLARFSIMYSKKGIVVGAGYTDVIVFLPIMKLLMILAVLIALIFFFRSFFKKKKIGKRHIIGSIVILYIVIFLIGPTLIPGIIQSLKVSPNELNLETPYIMNNIKFTNLAYGLSNIQIKDFSVQTILTPDILTNNSKTIDNVRILDWRPLTQTYKQTQEIRLYYDLSGIDIDRYDINGKYTQIMLSPREMNQQQIVANAKTWVNLHMIYTHGFGVVMSPVNTVTKEGLPLYLIKDIPPVNSMSDESLIIKQPRIYYGQRDNEFVLVNTNTNEFDYPKGDTNKYINYDGVGGVLLDSFFKKLLIAAKFFDIKILLSSDITSESRIMFDRNIQDRISKITPFLMLDKDPYMVIDDGRLFWIQDAYTVSGNFPYSDKFGPINYIRNSVKIVVDAYNGDVTYYVVDKSDPLILTYANIFPKQFKSIDVMPAGLKKHIRYPEDLFNIQATIFSTYHMNDPSVFYNKEDAWQIPTEIYGTGQQIKVDPYYIIMKLPGEANEEFVLMSPFNPIKKDNMIAWLAARSDGDEYGKLLLYKFPKDKLIYGPLQIEAKFDQDSVISQQITLWSQQGSRVTRGNLLVIPIDNGILYIEPLYIQAETGQLPELKRILISDGQRVVMEETLGKALEVLFGKSTTPTQNENKEKSLNELILDAQNYYDAVLDSMGKNWTEFGDNFDKLGSAINALSKE